MNNMHTNALDLLVIDLMRDLRAKMLKISKFLIRETVSGEGFWA